MSEPALPANEPPAESPGSGPQTAAAIAEPVPPTTDAVADDADVTPAVEEAGPEHLRRKRWWHTSFASAVGALAFGALSLTPSLLPRSGAVQGLVTGVAIVIGYGLGALVAWLVRQFTGAKAPWTGTALAWKTLAAVGAVVTVVALVYGKHYQDKLATLMGTSTAGIDWYVTVVVFAAVVGLLILAICRAVNRFSHWVTRRLGRYIPARTAGALGVIAAVVVTVLILNGVVLDGLLNAMDSAFQTKNNTTTEGTVQPASTTVSGGPQSQISWDKLGRKGRDFIGGVTSTADLNAFNGGGAKDPIRVYVGIESSSDPEKRAALAVQELVRMGAFDRKVLAIGTTTGTGWIDENAADPLEYMFNGDTAIVATQYSYLPSWLSFLVDKSRAKAAGVTLFDAVYAEWIKHPVDARPKLFVFGESLGTFGGEEAFSGLPDIANRTSGVLWAGPPNTNELWRRYTADRDPGSYEVKPTYRQGETLRWAQQPEDLTTPTADWAGTRVLYLQNASDPIVWWAPRLLTSRPDWLKEPAGRDVLPQLHWVPVLTFFQVSADMMNSTGVPTGHGHSYNTNQAWAWAAVAQPPGWTDAKTAALITKLSVNGS
jgi:uncharacterized membrane protein